MKLNMIPLAVVAAAIVSAAGAPEVLAASEPVIEVNCICKEQGGKRY